MINQRSEKKALIDEETRQHFRFNFHNIEF